MSNVRTVVVTGSSGLIGRALGAALRSAGRSVRMLVRRTPRADGEFEWAPEEGRVDPAALEGADAVVHLAGESIADGRWTEARKQRIRDSRVIPTRLLARVLAASPAGPRTLVCASAIGYYGDRGEETLTDDGAPGDGFLADVCREWEAAADPARDASLRVAHARLGIVLSGADGALARMLLPFRLGLGGRLGSGRQWWSWVALDDAVAALVHLVDHDGPDGGVNVTSPEPVRNADFTRVLGRVLHRPAIAPVPPFAARLALGEMADALLLSSARVVPQALLRSGFAFGYAGLEPALRHLLNTPGA